MGITLISATHRKHGIHTNPFQAFGVSVTHGLLMGLQVGISVAVKETDNARDCA
jgi:hypothetical protein